MKHLFYLFIVVPILIELYNIGENQKVHNFIKKIKNTKDNKFDYLTGKQSLYILMNFMYLIWGLVGLFTNQWVLFLFLMVFIIPLKQHSHIIRWIDSFVSLILLLFIVINEYHLKIDILDYIINF